MRIRKNAKFGSVPLDELQTHVCQLNQSPWDVIPFAVADNDDFTKFEDVNDEEEDNSFARNGNGSPSDSVGAVESVASMMDADDDKSRIKIDEDDNDDNGTIEADEKKTKTTSCRQCKNKEGNKQGQSYCEHNNLSSVRLSSSSKKATVARRSKARAVARKAPMTTTSAAASPYEFYYYSGFGPRWGKRRGGGGGSNNNNKNEVKGGKKLGGENSTITELANNAASATIQSNSHCSSLQVDNVVGFDYAENYDDDEDEEDDDDDDDDDYDVVYDGIEDNGNNGESGKKRTRKPVKARSLKSLM